MPESLHMRSSDLEAIGVNFPFTITLEHPQIELQEMFELTQAFDMYEMERDDKEEDGALIKQNILVDVLEVTPTITTIKVTPAQAMPYRDLAKHVQIMFDALSKRLFSRRVKVIRVTWEIDKTGVASDLRGMLRKI